MAYCQTRMFAGILSSVPSTNTGTCSDHYYLLLPSQDLSLQFCLTPEIIGKNLFIYLALRLIKMYIFVTSRGIDLWLFW